MKGKYNDQVLGGFIQAMVQKHDCEARRTELQNFKYAPAWDELSYIIHTLSPRAYKALLTHFPSRDNRSICLKESRVPKFP